MIQKKEGLLKEEEGFRARDKWTLQGQNAGSLVFIPLRF